MQHSTRKHLKRNIGVIALLSMSLTAYAVDEAPALNEAGNQVDVQLDHALKAEASDTFANQAATPVSSSYSNLVESSGSADVTLSGLSADNASQAGTSTASIPATSVPQVFALASSGSVQTNDAIYQYYLEPDSSVRL